MVLYSYWLKIELFWLVCLSKRLLNKIVEETFVQEAQQATTHYGNMWEVWDGYCVLLRPKKGIPLKTATVSSSLHWRGWLVSKHSGGEHLPSNVLVTAQSTRQTLVSRQCWQTNCHLPCKLWANADGRFHCTNLVQSISPTSRQQPVMVGLLSYVSV